MPDPQSDPAQDILKPLAVSQAVKAAAWDVYQVDDKATFEKRLSALPLAKEAKAKLWDAKYAKPSVTSAAPDAAKPGVTSPKAPDKKPSESWTDYAKRNARSLARVGYESIPMITGATGGMLASEFGPIGTVAGAGAGGLIGKRLQQYVRAITPVASLPQQALPPTGQALAEMGGEATSQMLQEAVGQVVAAPLGWIRRGGFVPKTPEVVKTIAENKRLGTKLSGPEIASGTTVGEIGKTIQGYSGGAFYGSQAQRAVRERGTAAAFAEADDVMAYLGHPPIGAGSLASKPARTAVGQEMMKAAENAPPVDMRPIKAAALDELQKNVVPRLAAFPDTVKNAKMAQLIRAIRNDPSLIQRMPRPAVLRVTDELLEHYKGDKALQTLREVLGSDDDTPFTGVWQQFRSLRGKSTPAGQLYAKDDAQRVSTYFTGQFRKAMSKASPDFDVASMKYRDLERGDYIRSKIVLGGKAAPHDEASANAALTTMAQRMREQTEKGVLPKLFDDPKGQQVVKNMAIVANLMEKRTPVMSGNLRKIFEIGRVATMVAGATGSAFTGHPIPSMAPALLWEGIPDFFTWVVHDPKATQWFVEGVAAKNPSVATSSVIRLMNLYRQSHRQEQPKTGSPEPTP